MYNNCSTIIINSGTFKIDKCITYNNICFAPIFFFFFGNVILNIFAGEKKPVQPRPTGGERNVKFPAESREERNNRRNREEGDTRPPRDNRRGPPG